MLSFGYTLLYNHIATALAASGLDARTGFYHRQHGAYAALACDLQEELRYLVDAFVWSLVRRREIRPGDFAASPDGRYPCLLRPAARRAFLRKFERRLETEFRPPGYDDALTYRAFIDRQAQQVKDLVNGARDAYEPLRIRA
jgi:CRISPR-associated protein Cas1